MTQRISFAVAPDDKERLLDALLPLLARGVREREREDGRLEISSVGLGLPPRELLERAAGVELQEFNEEEVPSDWRERRAMFGTGHLVADRLLVRDPGDPPPDEGLIDVVIAREGSAFGSGSHPTTRMCLELMLGLEPGGAAVDLGCGVGVLAIAAAKLGFAPVSGLDRDPEAIEAALENGARNGVEIAWELADLLSVPVPLAPLVLANAPPPVHARVAQSGAEGVRHVIVSGIALHEVDPVLELYGTVGLRDVLTLEDEAWAAILLTADD